MQNAFPKAIRIARDRRSFTGGADARIIMGDDEAALLRLWREKRGEAEPKDLSGNLIVQLGAVTEELDRRWYEDNTGRVITDFSIPASVGWAPLSTDAGRQAGQCLRPSSCCRGRFQKRRQWRNTCGSCSTTCGWWRRDQPSCR
jgi:hypothetical protein